MASAAETTEQAVPPTDLKPTPNDTNESSSPQEYPQEKGSVHAASEEVQKNSEDDVLAAEPEKGITIPNEANEPDEGAHYVHGAARIALVFGLCVTTFLVGLDQLIIATAIPKITTLFHSLEDVGWYGSAYLLCTTSLQPSFGKIYTYFDVKWTFVIALFLFEVGSVICATARDSPMLIVGRAIAGAGGAGLYSGGMTILGYSIPLNQRAIYLAAFASMFGISSIVGPILGGAFTDKLTWRWCFWINLPFGGVAIAIVSIFFKSPNRDFSHIPLKQKIREMDLPGAFFLISAITCLLLALSWGGVKYPWKDSKVWGCLLGFGLLIIVFIIIQFRKGEHATIPAPILKQRSMLAAALTLSFLSMGIYTHVYYLPFYFQAIKGTTAEQSGIRCIAYLISNTVASLVFGGIVTFVGYYTPFIWFGAALFTVGAGMIYTLKVDSGSATWIGYQIIAGFGAGGCIQLPFIAVQTVLKPKDMPTGNAIAIFFNSLGGAIAISIAENIFSNTLVQQIPKNVPGLDPYVLIQAGATHIRELVTPAQLPGTLYSYNKALTTAFILPIAVAGIAFCSSLLFEWRSIKGKNLLAGGPA